MVEGELARGLDIGEREGREMVVDGGETEGGQRWLVLVRVRRRQGCRWASGRWAAMEVGIGFRGREGEDEDGVKREKEKS